MKSPVIVVSGIAHLLAMLCFSAWGLSADFSTSVPSFSLSNPALQISRTSPERTTISLAAPQIIRMDSAVGFRTYQLFSAEGESFLRTEGQPALPQITRFYRIPNTGSVELNIGNTAFDMLDQIDALPYHELQTGEFKDRTVYQRDEWFPPQVAVMSAPMVFRDFRVVTVTLYPVQINPVTKQARVYRQIEAEIVANSTPGENELVTTRRLSGAFAPLYRHLISNLDEGALDDATTTPGTYLILAKAHPNTLPWVDSLRVWKSCMGYNVAVDTRATWTTSTMQTTIRNLYNMADPPLEYVCIIGDPGVTFGCPTDLQNYDHTFALGNATDDLEDIYIGRLSGSSMAEMATINAKIMSYERNPQMDNTEWFTRGLFYSTFMVDPEFSTRNVSEWSAQQFSNFTGVTNNQVIWNQGHVSDNAIQNAFNGGLGYFFWTGSWIGQMESTLPTSFVTNQMLPITMTLSEATGNFESGLSISEAFLVAGSAVSPKGGVCGIGTATSGVHSPWCVCISGGVTYGIANLGLEHLAQSLVFSKQFMYTTWGINAIAAQNMSRWTNLIGEPALEPWTQVPRIMEVTHPDTIFLGTHNVMVSVRDDSSDLPLEGALVVLWRDSVTFERILTEADGMAILPISASMFGSYTLTVTKHHWKPDLASIYCRTSTMNIAYGSCLLDDDSQDGTSGNNNHQINPGEIIDLAIYLRNTGSTFTGTSITTILTCPDSGITILTDHADYPDLLPGDSAVSTTPFRIQVSPQMRNLETALLTLTIVTSDSTVESSFPLISQAPKLSYVSHATSTPPGPGTSCNLVAVVRNNGLQDMPDAIGVLHSRSPLVAVIDSLGSFGTINVNFSRSDSLDPFLIQISETAFMGSQIPMLLTISNPAGFTDSVAFTLSLGTVTTTDPTGPDAYGYYAFDNLDLVFPQHPDFNYLDISTGLGTDLSLDDPGWEVEGTPFTVARRLPFAFKFYGHVYDTITICANGWAAFGDQSWNGTFRNYPIPGILAPDAMLAPYWDDLATATDSGLGVWDYYDQNNHQYVIQWKATGAAAFNAQLDFEIIICDTTFHVTTDGNGKIMFQYQSVVLSLPSGFNEPAGCTIGIQNSGGLEGISYLYIADYAPGAAAIQAGRAILFLSLNVSDVVSAIGDPLSPAPEFFTLYPNYPNPFNPSTTICYDLPQSGFTTLIVYDVLGRQVASLVNGVQSAGSYRVSLDGKDLGSGVYFCRLENNGHVQTSKMMLIR